MPRISADAAATAGIVPEATLPTARLDPPQQLGVREAAEWQAIVARLGAAWLPREAHALLTAYCNIVVQLNDVHQALAAFGSNLPEDEQGWARYKELTELRNKLVRSLASLATKLRLTPQTRVNRYAAGTQAHRRADRPPPWAAIHDDSVQ